MSMKTETTLIPGPTLIDRLKWRYATKTFDAARKIPSDDWKTLEQAALLSPSSFGLQPWRMIVVVDPALRQQLLPVSWNQKQVVDASHLAVIAAKVSLDPAFVDARLQRTADVRGVPVESMAGYRQMMVGFITAKGPAGTDDWCVRQAYLALGVLLATAADLGVDACPMEGIDGSAYDRLLGLGEQGYTAVVATAFGYRSADDKSATLPKVRPEEADVLRRL